MEKTNEDELINIVEEINKILENKDNLSLEEISIKLNTSSEKVLFLKSIIKNGKL